MDIVCVCLCLSVCVMESFGNPMLHLHLLQNLPEVQDPLLVRLKRGRVDRENGGKGKRGSAEKFFLCVCACV